MARRNRSFFFNNKTGELKSDGKVVVDATNTTNILQTKGSTTGNPVAINAVGDDTNIDINISPKGSGEVNIAAGNLNYAGTAITATGAELNILDGVTATTAEINYLDGVTSSIQTQIDNISSSFTLAADSGTNDTFTTGQTLTIAGGTGIDTTVSDNQISIAIDSTVATLTGTQTLTNKTLTAPIISSINNTGTLTLPTSTGTVALTSDITLSTLSVTATASELNILDGVTATTAEINYTDGVTSAIQTQLDAKLALAGGTMSGAIAMGTNKITGMGDPTAAQDAATKAYVDSQVSSVPTGDITAVNITAGTGLSGTVTTASGDHTQTLSIDSTVATLTGSQTLTNKTLTAPVISSITNTGTLTLPTSTGTVALTSDITLGTLSVTATASELNILDGVTATTAELNYSDGVTSNIQTQLDTKASLTGSETLTNKTLTSPQVNTNIDLLAQADVRFYDSDSSNYVGFQSPATVTGNILWTLPSSDGTEGQVLSTNGGGTLGWEDPGSGGGSGSSYPNSTFSTVPGTNGNFDMSYNVAQTTQETPFEASGTDAFGVNLGSVFSLMDPIGSLESIDYGDSEAYVGA